MGAAGHRICPLRLPLLKNSRIIRSASQRSRQRCAATLSLEVSRTVHGGINVSVNAGTRMRFMFVYHYSSLYSYHFCFTRTNTYQVTTHTASMSSNSTPKSTPCRQPQNFRQTRYLLKAICSTSISCNAIIRREGKALCQYIIVKLLGQSAE